MTRDVDATLPYRGPGPGRPAGVPLPPGRMPLARGGRMLKRWRYVGVYGPELMLCAGSVRIGPGRQEFWAVWDRTRGELRERTRRRHARVALEPGRVRVVDDGVRIDLALEQAGAVEVVTASGGQYAWTAKHVARARGTVTIDGEPHAVDAAGIVDDSAGYHARRTAWRWSAGVGSTADGAALAWNLVDGIHDSPERSERTVWVDGVPREVGPVRFAEDLGAVTFAEGGALAFAAETTRARRDNLLLVRSDYEQPFGTFSGTLPGGVALAEGYGVMERHTALW